MKRNPPFLFALLVLLTLDLLVCFVRIPSSDESTARNAVEAEEVLDALCEEAEQADEFEEFTYTAILQARLSPVAFIEDIVSNLSASVIPAVSPLAFGWRMPLLN